MELEDQLFLVSEQDNRRPGSIEQHQQNGCHAGDSVKIELDNRSINQPHVGGPDRVAKKSRPEKESMPPFQPPLQALRPHPDGVKHHGEVNEQDGDKELWIHHSLFLHDHLDHHPVVFAFQDKVVNPFADAGQVE